jgi:hypothetical protein
MKTKIKEQLEIFLRENYPEVILLFSDRAALPQYLEDRASWIEPVMDGLMDQGTDEQQIIDTCIREITASFGPSKYHYLLGVLEVEFPEEYELLQDEGRLKTEVTAMIVACLPAFDAFDFNDENQDDHFLRHMVIAELHDYLLSRPPG